MRARPLASTTAAELQRKVFPPVNYAVDGLIAEGLTILAGSPKVGKSWLALDIACAVASGGRALGSVPVDPAGVVMLALEDGERRLQDRMRMLIGGDDWPPGLHVVTRKPDNLLDRLSDHLVEYPDTRLVVVDTFARIRPRAANDGNAYQDDYRVAGALQSWAVTHNVCLVALHHDRKLASSDFVESVSGTYGLTGAADSILLLTRDRGEDDGLLQLTGRDIADDRAWKLRRTGPAWQLVETVNADVARAVRDLGDRSTEIVELVHRAGPVRAEHLETELGIDKATAHRYLGRLARAGRIRRTDRGSYVGVLSVPSVLSEQDTQDTQDTPTYRGVWE